MPFVINDDGDQVWEDWGQRAVVSTVPITVGGIVYRQQGNGQYIGTNGRVVDTAEISRAFQAGDAPAEASYVGMNLQANTATASDLSRAAAVTTDSMAAAQQASIQAAGIVSTAAIAEAKAISDAQMARLKISTGPNAGTYTENPNGTYFQISGPLAGRNVSAAQFDAAHATPPPQSAAVTPAAVTTVDEPHSLGLRPPTAEEEARMRVLAPPYFPVNPKTTPPALNVYNAAQISKPAALPIAGSNSTAAKIMPPSPTANTLGGIIEYIVELKWLQPAQKQGLNTTYGLPPGAMN